MSAEGRTEEKTTRAVYAQLDLSSTKDHGYHLREEGGWEYSADPTP